METCWRCLESPTGLCRDHGKKFADDVGKVVERRVTELESALAERDKRERDVARLRERNDLYIELIDECFEHNRLHAALWLLERFNNELARHPNLDERLAELSANLRERIASVKLLAEKSR